MRSAAQQAEVDRAHTLARNKLEFILDNAAHLRAVRNGSLKLQAAEEFWDKLERKEELTPNQIAYVDGIYESTWKGIGMPSVNRHADRKRRGLRYG